jgi:hypothetical protein
MAWRFLDSWAKRAKRVNEEHVLHVNLRKIVIVGQTEKEWFFLDGVHRAAKSQLLRKPLYYYELTSFETGQCLRRRRDYLGKRLIHGRR